MAGSANRPSSGIPGSIGLLTLTTMHDISVCVIYRPPGTCQPLRAASVTDDLCPSDAGRLAPADLRSLDATHLASAEQLGPDLRGFVTYDERLGDCRSRPRVPGDPTGLTAEPADDRAAGSTLYPSVTGPIVLIVAYIAWSLRLVALGIDLLVT